MPTDADRRADALLEGLQRQAGGRLTVFLGAAPGVGKTFAMLGRARELHRQGVDVVVGIVESHGRAETEALLEGLPVLPRRKVEYRGRALDELDLDAVLERRPQVVLIDELAHRNVPGSRHERRWQDVVEILDAGIDVCTTVNIQHLESLNDVVHRITGVRVTETVPDAVFDRLRDIKLIDLPPAELIERLQQGKVYIPEQAAQALQAFFSPGNLAALRELAMQAAADRVDSDLRELRAAQGLPGTPLRRRVLVAIDGRGQSEYLVRMGRRIAERRDAPWTVITVKPGSADADRDAEIDAAFALARRLGAETQELQGGDIVDGLLDFAARRNVSTIVLGRTRERPVARMFNRTLTQQLLQRAAHYELTIVGTPDARARARRRLQMPMTAPARIARDLGIAFGAVMAAVAVGAAGERWLGLTDLSTVFMVAVMLVAARTRMTAAVLAAVLSFAAYNFFFIPPRLTFYIAAPRGVATVVTFLLAALVAGRLASRLRAQVDALRAANAQAVALQSLGRALAGAADVSQVATAAVRELRRATACEALVLVRDDDPAAAALDERDRAAADWSRRHAQPAGAGTDTLGSAAWWFLPLAGPTSAVGVLGLRLRPELTRPSPALRRLAEAMADDIAQALVRARLVADLEDARVGSETERLRSALLSSVSHDLRSPLASIIGSAGSLEAFGPDMGEDDRRALLETIRLEGERLDRYIQNLLDMTRLGHGGLTLRRDWIGVAELVGTAVARVRRYLPQARVDVQVADDAGSLWVHPALVEQALFNVLENAVKFSPPDAAVDVHAQRLADGTVRIDVADRGPGIPDDERRRVFDMFYSVERGDRGRQGTGLGLAITQGMIGAHGGRVEALPGPGAGERRGTLIRIELPRLEPDDGR